MDSEEEHAVMSHARGIFEVTPTPQPSAEADPVDRLSITKHFSEGSSAIVS
jgi:hypothetical protein